MGPQGIKAVSTEKGNMIHFLKNTAMAVLFLYLAK